MSADDRSRRQREADNAGRDDRRSKLVADLFADLDYYADSRDVESPA